MINALQSAVTNKKAGLVSLFNMTPTNMLTYALFALGVVLLVLMMRITSLEYRVTKLETQISECVTNDAYTETVQNFCEQAANGKSVSLYDDDEA